MPRKETNQRQISIRAGNMALSTRARDVALMEADIPANGGSVNRGHFAGQGAEPADDLVH
jgi:hypothetical protein